MNYRLLVVLLLLLKGWSAFSQSEDQKPLSYFGGFGDYSTTPYYLARRGSEIFVLREEYRDYERFRVDEIRYSSDGYGRIKLFGWQYIVVEGPDISILVNTETNKYTMYRPDLKVWPTSVIQSISATSYLREEVGGKVVEYKPENMIYVYVYTPDGPSVYYHIGLPWVEGELGPGIGTVITAKFGDKDNMFFNSILILNGFVDFRRLHLYKANNRVKRFEVRSADGGEAFKFIVELEDKVKIQEIKFPRRAFKVMLTILDVYRGERWNDTCIRGFLLKDPNESPHPNDVKGFYEDLKKYKEYGAK